MCEPLKKRTRMTAPLCDKMGGSTIVNTGGEQKKGTTKNIEQYASMPIQTAMKEDDGGSSFHLLFSCVCVCHGLDYQSRYQAC